MTMTKERIIMTHEEITNDSINIGNDHTCFCRKKRISYPDINELEKEVKTLRKLLKSKNVKLYKTDTLKTLKECKKGYNEMVNDYNNTFDQLVSEWKEKIETGIYTGYVDDEHLNGVIRPLDWKLQRMNYRNTLLSKIRDIQRKVNEVNYELAHGTNFVGVGI